MSENSNNSGSMSSGSPTNLPKVDYGNFTLFKFYVTNDVKPVISSEDKVVSPPVDYEYEEDYTNETEVADGHGDLVEFSDWLHTRKALPDYLEIKDKVNTVAVVPSSTVNKLWNTLYRDYHQIDGKGLAALFSSLLVSYNFVVKFKELPPAQTEFENERQKKRFEKIWKASVKIIQDVINSPVIPENDPLVLPDEVQQKSLLQHAVLARELHKKNLTEDQLLLFDKARGTYNEEYNSLLTQYNREYSDQINNLPDERPLDPEGNPEPMPVYNPPQMSFDLDYLSSKDCFESLAGFINDLKTQNLYCGDVKNIDQFLKEMINQRAHFVTGNLGGDYQKVVKYGSHTIVQNREPLENSYIISMDKILPTDEKYTLFITHFSKDSKQKVNNIYGALTIGSTNYPFTNAYLIENTVNYTSFIALKNQIPAFEGSATLNATLSKLNILEQAQDIQHFLQLNNYTFGPVVQIALDGEPGIGSSKMFGIKKVGIREYMRVEQSVCCYVPGEVSRIENIMAREFRKKFVRDLEQSEVTSEETEETEREKTTDTSSTDRHEMSKEVAKMFAQENSSQFGFNMNQGNTFKAFGGEMSINSGMNMNTSNSSSQSNNFNQAENIAKEVTQKATDRLVQKIGLKRTSRMLREHEETNEHGFDNRKGSSHVVGIYRWVDKIYENKVYNYGKRLQYDFMLPEPSRNFKAWMAENPDKAQKAPVEPRHPSSFKLPTAVRGSQGNNTTVNATTKFNWTDVFKENYALLAAEYGADVEPFPIEEIRIAKSFSQNPQGKFPADLDEPRDSYQFEVEVPDGYQCVEYTFIYNHVLGHKGKWNLIPQADIVIAGFNHFIIDPKFPTVVLGRNNQSTLAGGRTLTSVIGQVLPIGISTFNIGGFALNITAICKVSEGAINQWKQKTFAGIMEAYNKKMYEYQNALAEYEQQLSATKNESIEGNPLHNRIVEGRELKRLCIETMTLQLGLKYHNDGYKPKNNNGVYELNPSFVNNQHADLVLFLEQAFEWDIMSYEYFPYMYAEQGRWKDLIKISSSSDPIFEAFLQSGMARVSLTVRPDFEQRVLFFLDTGIVPNENMFVPEGKESWYYSITNSLGVDEKEKVGDSWETRVPTDLVILQSDAAPLDQTGLPCACKQDDEDPDGIAMGSSEMDGNYTDYGGLVGAIQTSASALVDQVFDRMKGETDKCEELRKLFNSEYQRVILLISDFEQMPSNEQQDSCPTIVPELDQIFYYLNNLIKTIELGGCEVADLYDREIYLTNKIAEIRTICGM